MHVPFNQMPSDSRIWIYQSGREFSSEECVEILSLAEQFTAQWSAHSRDLMASCELLHNRFLIFAVNESAHSASGCSIDSSVRFVQSLEQRYGTTLMDRQMVYFENSEGEIFSLLWKDIAKSVSGGDINEETFTFDNLITTLHELNQSWKKKAGDTWLKKYFTNLHKTVLN